MCELFGFSGAKPADLTGQLQTFFSHSETNPHGWGMMYENGGRVTVRSAEKAAESAVLPALLGELPPQRAMLAHIRYATVGRVREENCHPFTAADITGREWTLIHNGTIYSGGDTYRYYKQQSGDTDSERLFLAFMDRLNERLSKGGLTERERFTLVNGFVTEHSPRNKLNLLLWDGELLYAHKNLRNTLSFKRLDEGVLIATVPLDSEGWIPFPLAQLIAYKNGREAYRGERHKGVFVPTLEYITALDAMNI